MAQTVTINKQSYSDVPFVLLNKTDGTGQAKYVDTSDATASSSDLMAGKKAYVNGQEIVGTMEIATSEQIKDMFDSVFGEGGA